MTQFFTRRQALAAAVGTALAGLASAQPQQRRIGFVDDNLDNYHARVFLQIFREALKGRGFAVAGATALQHEPSRAWARQQKLDYYESAEQLNKVVDFFAILAPASPKTHWELCQRVLPLGKTTFVDKTFAPDVATAERIFTLADKHQVALQTSSALRYTAVQRYVASVGRDSIRHVIAWGGGGSYEEYVIHPLEMAISCLGHEAVSLMRRGTEPESQLLINFTHGRTGIVNVYNKRRTPFAAAVTTAKETRYLEVDTKNLFVDAAAAMLDFFAAGKPDIDRRETLAIMRILDAARDAASLERFVKL